MASLMSIGSSVLQGRRRSMEQYGDQLMFYVKALAWTPRAIKRYPREVMNTLDSLLLTMYASSSVCRCELMHV